MTVTGLCHLADVSERTLQYAFLEITGFSMQQYLMRYRLLRARALLTAGNVNLAREAAVAVGIPHTGRFSLYFRKMYGKSPSMLLTPPSKSSTVSVS
jgi:transcriptional regulator GlxA family with amidase domain